MGGVKEKIIDLFKQRETHFVEDTDNILAAMTSILDGVCAFVEVERDNIVVDRVMLIKTKEVGHVVVITVSLPIKPDKIPPNVPKNHTGELKHLLSIGVPVDMADATKEDTVKFLKESERRDQGLPVTEDIEIAQAMAEKSKRTVH